MIKRIYIPILASAALLFGGCENNFDAKIYGSLMEGEFPNTAEDYVSYMMSCYIPFAGNFAYAFNETGQYSFYIGAGGDVRFFDSTSDIMAPTAVKAGGEWLHLSQANFNQCRYYYRGWPNDQDSPNHFPQTAEVTRFTEIIHTLETASETVLSAEVRDGLLGEARLCRGMMLYYLMHMYGPVPVIMDYDKVFDDLAQRTTVRPSLDQMCGWIYDDLLFAAQNAPEIQTELGRYTRDYGRFCLMRHCLNEGGHMSGYYKKGLEMFDELKGKYSLFTQGDNPYKDLFKTANEWNCEIIMAVSCDANANGNEKHGNINMYSRLVVPSEASAYSPDGVPTALWPQGGGYNAFYNVAKDFYDSFEAGDKRKDCIVTDYWTTDGKHITGADLGTRWDGYISLKYPIETESSFQGADMTIARWSDALLQFAELSVRESGAVTSEAIDAVNQVRHRAGLGNLSAAQTAGKDAFLDAILTERGHELYYEGCRKIDLIRHNKYARKVFEVKKTVPTHQYMPLPDYAVRACQENGVVLEQTFQRDGWNEDRSSAEGGI